MIEKSYNVSVRRMFNLPRETHCFFIEEISECTHIKYVLLKRFLSFMEQIKKSPKVIPKKLLNIVKNDALSVTGSNLRNILLLIEDKFSVDDLNKFDLINMIYCPVTQENEWKIKLTKEIIDVKFGDLKIDNFAKKNWKKFLHLCAPVDKKSM